MDWFVYILICADQTFYTGIAKDITKRQAMHEKGNGAKYTRGRGPFTLAYSEPFQTKGAALKREAEIKGLTKDEKKLLISAATI